jgi:hypothetical protein
MNDHRKKNEPKSFRQGLYLVFTALLILTTFTVIIPSSSSSTSSFSSPLIISSASAQEENKTMDQGPSPTPDEDEEKKKLFATTAGPDADAGSDLKVNEGDTVSLNGDDSSDPDDDNLSFKWTQKEPSSPAIVLNGAVTSQASFTAPQVEADTPFVFELTVTDENGGSDSDSVEVLVRNNAMDSSVSALPRLGEGGRTPTGELPGGGVLIPIKRPPNADAGPEQTVKSGDTVTLDGTGSSDPDGGTIAGYSWKQTVCASTVNLQPDSNVPKPTFTAPSVQGDCTFELVVTDDEGATSSPSSVVVRVQSTTNQLPIANAGSDATAKPGDPVTLDGSASNDPDGDKSKLKYNWRQSGGTASTYPVTLSFADPVKPTFTVPSSINVKTILSFELTVTDEKQGVSAPPPDTVDITIDTGASPPTNQPPIANAGTDITTRGGETGTLNGTGSTDPEGSPLNYEWIKVAGPSTIVLSDDLSSKATFTAPSDSKDSLYVFELKVTDSGGLSSTDQVFVTLKEMQQQQDTSRISTDQCLGEQQQPRNTTMATTQSQTPLPFRQYENVTYGIRMMYPDNWTISQSNAKPVAVFSAPVVPSSQEEESPIRAPATVILNVNSLPVQNMTLDQYSTEYLIGLINSPTHHDLVLDNVFGFNMTGPTYQTIGGQQGAGGEAAAVNSILPFHLVEYSGVSFVDGCNIRGVDLWTVIDNKVYSITYLAVDPVYYTTYLPLAEQMVGSFQVIDGGNGNKMDTSGATTTSQELAIPTATSNDNRDPTG